MSSSGSTSADRPYRKKINDSLNELYTAERPRVEIIFFHGLHLGDPKDTFWKTWTTPENECWPQTVLTRELPWARVLSVAYDSSVARSDKSGRLELYNIGENLMGDVICSSFANVANCPVFLVAHSLGGLVVKQLILHADEEMHRANPNPKLKIFLDNLRGIFYFSTPHAGADITSFTSYFSHKSPVTSFLSFLSTQGARLNENFRKWRGDRRVTLKAYAVAESDETRVRGHSSLVVTEASARYDVDMFQTCKGDHFTVCAPSSPGTNSGIQSLMSFIKGTADFLPDNFQHLPKYISGIHSAVEEIKAKLTSCKTLGLYGMGGIGKTTLAKAVFNILSPQYEYSCFIEEVKNKGGVGAVKMAVLQGVHHRGKKINSDEGSMNILRGKLLFLILDDAASEESDLEILSRLQDDIEVDEGSRFIVTSRDAEVLKYLDDSYRVLPLDRKFSTSLFTSLAFAKQRDSTPPASFQGYVDTVVTKCEGLPLTLQVLGKYLCNKKEAIWKQALRALDTADAVAGFDEKLWARLRVSYDGLNKEDQEMFLDAATVLNRCPLVEAKEVWSITMKKTEEMRWQNLIDMSLVWEVQESLHVKELNVVTVGMHEQLRSLGRNISEENGKCSRVWDRTRGRELLSVGNSCSCDDVEGFHLGKVVVSGDGIGLITAINNINRDLQRGPRNDHDDQGGRVRPGDDLHNTALIFSRILKASESNGGGDQDTWERGTRLLFQQIYDSPRLELGQKEGSCDIFEGPTVTISRNLLCSMKKLKYLSFGSVDIDRIEGEPFPATLVFLKWSGANFEHLPLEPDFLNLKSLVYMRLLSCERLQTLPPNFGQLPALRHLEIKRANALVSLPNSFGKLSHLERLTLAHCRSLESLPETFGELLNLNSLEIFGCGLRTLPLHFGRLSKLHRLDISGCNNLETLPETFGHLQRLKEFAIKRCPELQRLPETFGNLGTLETLLLEDCDALSTVPDKISRLSKLKTMIINGCQLSKMLPNTLRQLPSLDNLSLRDSTLESIVESEASLVSLKTLTLQWWHASPGFPLLPRWLGNVITPRNIQRDVGWTFNITDGEFNLKESEEDKEERIQQEMIYLKSTLQELHSNMMRMVKDRDYERALADFVVDLEPLYHQNQDYYLQERGILKRLNGDLRGALADLTRSLEGEFEDDYECRKHLGFVKFLMGDKEGARIDAERAVKVKHDLVDNPDYVFEISEDGSKQLRCLGVDSVEYLGFKL